MSTETPGKRRGIEQVDLRFDSGDGKLHLSTVSRQLRSLSGGEVEDASVSLRVASTVPIFAKDIPPKNYRAS